MVGFTLGAAIAIAVAAPGIGIGVAAYYLAGGLGLIAINAFSKSSSSDHKKPDVDKVLKPSFNSEKELLSSLPVKGLIKNLQELEKDVTEMHKKVDNLYEAEMPFNKTNKANKHEQSYTDKLKKEKKCNHYQNLYYQSSFSGT